MEVASRLTFSKVWVAFFTILVCTMPFLVAITTEFSSSHLAQVMGEALLEEPRSEGLTAWMILMTTSCVTFGAKILS